tara:strand:- start:10194 stop:11705 length:1512 start_codon:yes stop_codon:yes gene_type:complete
VGELERFIERFSGLNRAYGTTAVVGLRDDGKKKVDSFVQHGEPTVELWQQHLEGKEPSLGIIPITDENTCRWGCIDIDDFSLDLKDVNSKIQEREFPLILCRSKSGGAHLFLFIKGEVPASLMRLKLSEMSASLGFASSEIFPKQSSILTERGDTGNFLNMPYFGGNNTTRYSLNDKGESISLVDFLDLADNKQITEDGLVEFKIIKNEKKVLNHGPPCLQFLVTQGFPQGTRNNGLFNLGIYAKLSDSDNWEQKLEEYNREYLSPPLGSSEVLTIIKQLKTKEYNYKCNDQPICSHCNSGVCKTRKFGISPTAAMPSFGSLTKQNSSPPVWFLDVEGNRLEMMTEDLQNQTRFQKVCMEAIDKMPPKMSERAWQGVIQNLLDNVTIIEVPKDASIEGQFQDLLEAFCTDRAQAQTKDEILLGKPHTENGKTYFRLSDLEAYLQRHNFRQFTRPKITARLRDLGADHSGQNIKNRFVNLWAIPTFSSQTDPFDLPDFSQEDVI